MRKATTRAAFTLVELLVVIGIIAVMISILLPALNKVRQHARLVECGARLRQVGIATHAYAADNKGQIPPTRGDVGRADYNYAANFRNNHGWPSGADQDIRSNIGRLIFRKYLSDERMIECPLSIRADEDPTRFFDSHYCYNVHVKLKGPSRLPQVWWKKVSGFGKTPKEPITVASGIADRVMAIPTMDRALACDQMGNNDFGARAITHQHGDWKYYNLLFIDGSVRTAKMRSNIRRDPLNSWARFLDMLGYCEALINGTAEGAPNNQYNLIPVEP